MPKDYTLKSIPEGWKRGDEFPPNMRKCPIHRAWIQVRDLRRSGKEKERYCPQCDLERLYEEAKKGPAQPVKVRIMKI